MQRGDSFEKTLTLGKIEGRRRGLQDEMVGWHHRLDGHGIGWTPGAGDGQGGLVCCDSWGHKESDTTERLNCLNRPKLCNCLIECYCPVNTHRLILSELLV